MPDPSTNFLNVHEWAYGATEVLHILSLTLAVGLIAVVDLQLLGVDIGRASSSRLQRAAATGSVIGLVLAITTGLMVLSTDPIRYVEHPTMRFKLVVLAAAIAFNYAVHTRVARGDYSPAVRRAVGATSLLLWVAVVFSGIFYAFT